MGPGLLADGAGRGLHATARGTARAWQRNLRALDAPQLTARPKRNLHYTRVPEFTAGENLETGRTARSRDP
eukprot:10798746-Lingulodinium_polyedra.AAC.1